MATRHPLICIEGIDGSGKKTNSKALVEWLKGEKLHATYVDFPKYGNITGKVINEHLRKKWQAAELERECLLARKSAHDELVFQCLMAINRYEAADDLVKCMEKGPVVLDRYWPSGYVYGLANGLSADFLEAIHARLPQPDICILVDIPVLESFKRRPDRRDRFEVQQGMLEQVRWLYLELFHRKKWSVINGMGALEEVQQRIRECIPRSLFM